ncbi:MAG TPA: Spy/CpxP family protein refolding chaperone [Methylotenera sp.]|nr:Spy/CpxP family protein refolding chaperone [Methylotenera sp.]
MMNSLFTFKKVVAASILALSLPLASLAIAHDNDAHDGPHCNKGGQQGHGQGFHKSGLPPHLKALDLSDKQKDEIFALMHNQAPAFREQHKERMKLMAELRQTSQAEQFDDAKAQQIADRLAALDREKTLSRARTGAKIYALLTPEQRAKAREFKWERHSFDHDQKSKNSGEGQQPTAFRPFQPADEPRMM